MGVAFLLLHSGGPESILLSCIILQTQGVTKTKRKKKSEITCSTKVHQTFKNNTAGPDLNMAPSTWAVMAAAPRL